MHHLFTPNHVQLLNSCYPPASVLLAAGSTCSPNAQELSRLTYYASNHPGKLTKLGAELEKRLRNEARKARAGNIRARAHLLVTLSIFRALAIECRRDIALLSPPLVACIDITLTALPMDLEVVARAASVFTAWTTYTDGHLIGTDNTLTNDYLSALRWFSELSCSKAADHETRYRTRLIGFAALTGALNSEALYNDSTQFNAQVATIMRPILITLFETETEVLNVQAAAVKGPPSSPYLAEFRTRPTVERRAASIHAHIDGENGPSLADVSNASLHALFSLVSHANSAQLGIIMHSSFDSLEEIQAWDNLYHCCWLAERMAEWSQYQYRYAVPTWLVERLCRSHETAPSAKYHIALADMATSIFNSPTPLINLSTSDIAHNLITVLLRRTESEADDPLLPALIACISSLGRHVYYSDQILDLAGELINRLTAVEVQGVLSRGRALSAKSRTTALRCLLGALVGLIRTANKSKGVDDSDIPKHGADATPAETFKKEVVAANGRVSRRTSVPPDIWQWTTSLICNQEYVVRADYVDALIFYLSEEMPKDGDTIGDSRSSRNLAQGPTSRVAKLNNLLHAGNHGTKFLHVTHAYLYILATSSTLDLTSSNSTSPSHATPGGSPRLSVGPASPEQDEDKESASQSQLDGRRSLSTSHSPRARKVIAVQQLLEQTPSGLSSSTSACLADYTLILDVLTAIHEELPVRGLLTGVPMLLALDAAASNIQDPGDAVTVQRANATKEIIAKIWLVLGGVWNAPDLVQLAETALASGPACLPAVQRSNLTVHLAPRYPIDFQPGLPTTRWSGVNVEAALAVITSTSSVHEATGMDKEALLRRLSARWTPEMALKEAVEQSSSYENTVRGDGLAPLLKISPALMHIENISQQSLARSTRGVGVADLRGALEGRSSMSNPALARPASISTLEHAPSTTEAGNLRLTQTRSRGRNKKRSTPNGPGEVRDVLNRLGIGKQNGSLLKASFPPFQKSEQRSPPYKS
ncbi:putative cellular morphogenesis-related protein [Lyophyllum shimeji]|uniref:Cellular morphogenesis-related protein n=1 Tax=Lyophyllum shimeji TaxID=47721 RepID=A0A9P3PDM6_LYOSH|nr:putative cellular morphogenesis-related protein [Lyophyllum shimeji]